MDTEWLSLTKPRNMSDTDDRYRSWCGIGKSGIGPLFPGTRDGIDVGDEVVLFAHGPGELDLQISSRLTDPDTTVLAEAGQ